MYNLVLWNRFLIKKKIYIYIYINAIDSSKLTTTLCSVSKHEATKLKNTRETGDTKIIRC